MPPLIALIIFIGFIFFLFRFDPSSEGKYSISIWIPIVWFLIIGSRPIIGWLDDLGINIVDSSTNGNPIDQSLDVLLIVISFAVMIRRKIKLYDIIKNNKFIFVYILYCGIAITWSDYQLISLKRYFKFIGCVLILMVIISEPNRFEAFNIVIRRVAYILIPLSICFIKYFPNIGRGYSYWTGDLLITGVANNKNTLGRLCMVCALVFFWNIMNEWKNQKNLQSKIYVLSLFSILLMSMWLLYISNSVTSAFCFIAGAIIVILSRFNLFKQNPRFMGNSIIFMIGIFILIEYAFDIAGNIITSAGRNMTLTDRTKLWAVLLDMKTNPLIGTGFESFWLGERFKYISEIFRWLPNEAHNGYLEIYLNLGIIGLISLTGIIISGYRRVVDILVENYKYGVLGIAFFIMVLLYNISEAAFKPEQILWNVFLFMIIDYRSLNQQQEGVIYSGIKK